MRAKGGVGMFAGRYFSLPPEVALSLRPKTCRAFSPVQGEGVFLMVVSRSYDPVFAPF